jgi:CheY-like chemotaxis protein
LGTDRTNLKDILLVEDAPRDVELTMAALEDRLANKVAVADNGAEALAEFVSPRKGGG